MQPQARKAIDMAKEKEETKDGKWSRALKTGLTMSGFLTAIIVVIAICFIFEIPMATVGVWLAIGILVVVGVPLAIFMIRGTVKENVDIRDENATCAPIMKRYWSSKNTKRLVSDYEEWTKGEHSAYSRVHFGGEVIGELQDAKEYEEALRLLDELGEIEMKPRERYDYDTYREQARPQLLEGIEKQEKRAAERARNKNLK